MGIEKNPLAKPCMGCAFLGRNLGNCDYWLLMDKLRPCKPGKDCTVKKKDAPECVDGKSAEKRDCGGRRVTWDTEKAFQMYKDGATDREIYEALGIKKNTFVAYRKRQWGNANPEASTNWDTKKGLALRKKGMSYKQIAEQLGTTETAVEKYSRRHWRGER